MTKIGGLIPVLIIVAGVAAACGNADNQPAPETSITPVPQAANTIGVKATAADRTAAADILAKSVNRYRMLFADGQKIVGSKQYATVDAGLAAMGDPTSQAARFRDWRAQTGIEQDGAAGLDAFKAADAHFTADTEPPAISDWQTDIGTVQQDITQWVHVAADFQIKSATKSDLDQAADKVKADLEKADHDVSLVRGA